MGFDSIYIKECFSTIVDSMRTVGSISSIVDNNDGTFKVNCSNIFVANRYNIVNTCFVELLDSTNHVLGNYQVSGVTTSSFVIDSQTTPSGAKWKSMGPYYQYGHILEVNNILSMMDNGAEKQFQKYPLIYLGMDIVEAKGKSLGSYSDVSLQVLIWNTTEPNITAPERYTLNFVPILYPLYFDLLTKIHFSRLFITDSPRLIQHDKIDRVFWGNEGKYASKKKVMNDCLDCVDIENLKLRVKKLNHFPKNIILTN